MVWGQLTKNAFLSAATKNAFKHAGAGKRHIWTAAEMEVHQLYKQHCEKGLWVTSKWLRETMKIMVQRFFGKGAVEAFKTWKNWHCHFDKNHSIRLHQRTNNENISVEDSISKIKHWHAHFHPGIKQLHHAFVHHWVLPNQERLNGGITQCRVLHPKWGRVLPRN